MHRHSPKLARTFSLTLLVAALQLSHSAYALGPAETEAATLKIYVTGGGAADANLEATVRGLLNNPSTYTYGGNRRAFWAVSGTLRNPSPIPGIAAGTTVAFYKRTLGAAFTSTTVASAEAIEHLRTTLATGTAPNFNVPAGTVAGGQLALVRSDAGYSDTPLNLFTAEVNVPDGVSVPSAAALGTLVVKPINVALHGVIVTLGLRNALQQQQGLVVGSETEANIPNLSKAAVASLYQGRIADWTQIVHNGVPLQVAPGFSSEVYLVPRNPGAAIQASINARILNVPSNPRAPGPKRQDFNLPPYVYEPALPGDTDLIFHNFDRGTAFNWVSGDGNTYSEAAGLRRYAIGSQPADRNTGVAPPAASTTRGALNYRHIKIDGAAPTLRNAHNGTYPLTVEAVIVYRSASTPGGALVGTKRLFVDELARRIGSPAVLAANNNNFWHDWGQTGFLALSVNGHTPDATFSPANPVTGWTFGPGEPDIGRPAVVDDGVANPLLITQ
ncbi:MAG TPA: hypothetical protein DCY89_08325 [Gammaproteobacteria bacterium]|nr:hypothetical protein [Gammaproteobacteria bacterium]